MTATPESLIADAIRAVDAAAAVTARFGAERMAADRAARLSIVAMIRGTRAMRAQVTPEQVTAAEALMERAWPMDLMSMADEQGLV